MSDEDPPKFSDFLDFSNLIPTSALPESAAAQTSLTITQGQKAQLRAMGYTDAVIHEMAPDEAHKILDLT